VVGSEGSEQGLCAVEESDKSLSSQERRGLLVCVDNESFRGFMKSLMSGLVS
jgi:hypothetical protein